MNIPKSAVKVSKFLFSKISRKLILYCDLIYKFPEIQHSEIPLCLNLRISPQTFGTGRFDKRMTINL